MSSPVPMEKPRKCSELAVLLTCRASVLVYVTVTLIPSHIPISVLKGKSRSRRRSILTPDMQTSHGRGCASIFQVPHDGEKVHCHPSRGSRNGYVCGRG